MTINFTAHSVNLFIRVLNAIGYGDFIVAVDVNSLADNEKKQELEVKKLMRMIFENAGQPEAEKAINAFLCEVAGIKDVPQHYKEYAELRTAVFQHEEFKDFFMSAQASVVEMFQGLQ